MTNTNFQDSGPSNSGTAANQVAPQPVVYEIVRQTWIETVPVQKVTSRTLHVRVRPDQRWATNVVNGSTHFLQQDITPVSLEGLLTEILNALETLGIEIVQTPPTQPTPATMKFVKKDPA